MLQIWCHSWVVMMPLHRVCVSFCLCMKCHSSRTFRLLNLATSLRGARNLISFSKATIVASSSAVIMQTPGSNVRPPCGRCLYQTVCLFLQLRSTLLSDLDRPQTIADRPVASIHLIFDMKRHCFKLSLGVKNNVQKSSFFSFLKLKLKYYFCSFTMLGAVLEVWVCVFIVRNLCEILRIY